MITLDHAQYSVPEALLGQQVGSTTVMGQPIHFFHVLSDNPDALPILLLHGWPSSAGEFVGAFDGLTQPPKYGGRDAQPTKSAL